MLKFTHINKCAYELTHIEIYQVLHNERSISDLIPPDQNPNVEAESLEDLEQQQNMINWEKELRFTNTSLVQ